MALLAHEYNGLDIHKYEPLIESCLRFFEMADRRVAPPVRWGE